MSTIRLKVLRAFPVWRRKGDVKLGEVLELEWVDRWGWRAVGGAFLFVDSPKDSFPDFPGARLTFLIKEQFLCNPDDDILHE